MAAERAGIFLTEAGRDARDGDERRAITLRLPNETLAALQFVSAAIRRSSGAALGSSALVRGLIEWLAETDIDTRRIRSAQDLKSRLERELLGPPPSLPESESGT